MASVAEQLRQGRERLKWTIPQVAEMTKIRADHLRALEEGNYDVFTAPVYIKGFIRTYSTLLKMDTPVIMKELEAELSLTTKFKEPPRLSGDRGGIIDFIAFQLSKINWKVALPALVLATVVVGSVIGFRKWKEARAVDPLRNLGAGIYKGALPMDTVALPTNSPPR